MSLRALLLALCFAFAAFAASSRAEAQVCPAGFYWSPRIGRCLRGRYRPPPPVYRRPVYRRPVLRCPPGAYMYAGRCVRCRPGCYYAGNGLCRCRR